MPTKFEDKENEGLILKPRFSFFLLACSITLCKGQVSITTTVLSLKLTLRTIHHPAKKMQYF